MPLRSLRNQVLALLVISLAVYAFAASIATIYILKGCAEQGAVSKAKSDLAMAAQLIDVLYPGHWEAKGDRLYKGGVLMNDNPIVNRITELTGDTCTIFLHDVRIATTVPGPSGKPAVGTRVSEPVRMAVLAGGNDYYGKAIVVGQPYQTAYRPLRNADGEVIGMLYVGTPQTQIHQLVEKLMLSKVLVLAFILLILGLLTSAAFTQWFSPLRNVSKTLKAVALGDYDRPLEPPRFVEYEGIVESVERMRTDIKETFNRLQNLTKFGMRAVALLKEEEAYQLLVYYLKRLGVDEIIVVLIDEGHRLGRVVSYYSRPSGEEEYYSEPVARFNLLVFREIELCPAFRVLNPYVVQNANDDLGCRFANSTDPQIKSYACYPLTIGGQALGWVKIASRLPDFFDPDTRNTIEGYISITSAMIANLRLNELNRHLSLTDPLTSLYNRRFLEGYFSQQIAQANRRQEPFSLIFFDIDQFKQINDTYGHEVGDRVLAEVAKNTKGTLREVDLMVRYGGEEFIIVLPSTTLEGAMNVAEKIRYMAAATKVNYNSGDHISLTVSLGVAQYSPGTALTGQDLIHRADEAMYHAKLMGKNMVVAYKEGPKGKPVFLTVSDDNRISVSEFC